MKLNKFILCLCCAAIGLGACSQKNTPSGPGQDTGDEKKDSTDVTTSIDTTKAISIAEAIKLANTETVVVIKGYVTFAYDTDNKDGQLQQSAWIASTSKTNKGEIQAFWCNIKDSVLKGDYVAVEGKVTTHTKDSTTNYEIKNGKMERIRSAAPAQVTGDGSENNPYTVSDVIALNNTKKGPFFVKAFVVGQVSPDSKSVDEGKEFAAPFTDVDGSNTNILIGTSASDQTTFIPVKIHSTFKDNLNLPTNASTVLGKEIILYGSLEAYFGMTGIKSLEWVKINGKEYGTKPFAGEALLNETLLTQASFDKFTAISIKGDNTWTFSSQYGAFVTGYDDNQQKENANEDWFISPAFDATNGGTLTFDHARGPKDNLDVSTTNNTLWVSNDFSGDVTTATWTQMNIPTFGTTAWSYVSSGEIAIPATNRTTNCRIAWKYVSDDTKSAKWEIKNVLVK